MSARRIDLSAASRVSGERLEPGEVWAPYTEPGNPLWGALAYLVFVAATILLATAPVIVWAVWRRLL